MKQKTNEKTEDYKGDRITAWQNEWEEKDENGKVVKKKEIICLLYRAKSKRQPYISYGSQPYHLNLGECNDGSKFTAVSQAINQAKIFSDTCNHYGW